MVDLARKFRNVNAGGESSARAFNNDYPHLLVLIQPAQTIIELPGQLAAEGVHLVRTVQGNGADLVLVFHGDSGEFHGNLLCFLSNRLICLDINRNTTNRYSLTLKQIDTNVYSFFSGV